MTQHTCVTHLLTSSRTVRCGAMSQSGKTKILGSALPEKVTCLRCLDLLHGAHPLSFAKRERQ